MKFAKWVFMIGGIYGLVLVLPLYAESSTAAIFPPAINHPEYYYGFAAVVIAWQSAFIIIALDPLKYRLLMIPAILEKVLYMTSIIVLFVQARIGLLTLGFAVADLIWGTLFIIAYIAVGRVREN